jgi:glutaredoxin
MSRNPRHLVGERQVPRGVTRLVYPAAMTTTEPLPILVLGRDTCEDTVRSLAALDERGAAYTYRKVDEDAAADAWIRGLNDGSWRTPTILIGDPEQPTTILREPTDQDLLAAAGLG